MQPTNTLTRKVFLCVGKQSYDETPQCSVWGQSMKSCGYMTIAETEVTFALPEGFSLDTYAVQLLQLEKAELNKQFNSRLRVINEQLQKLQALEFGGSSERQPQQPQESNDGIPF